MAISHSTRAVIENKIYFILNFSDMATVAREEYVTLFICTMRRKKEALKAQTDRKRNGNISNESGEIINIKKREKRLVNFTLFIL